MYIIDIYRLEPNQTSYSGSRNYYAHIRNMSKSWSRCCSRFNSRSKARRNISKSQSRTSWANYERLAFTQSYQWTRKQLLKRIKNRIK